MPKKSAWLGVRCGGELRWLDAVEDSEWNDNLRAALARVLARRGVEAVAAALLRADVHPASTKQGKGALASIGERLRRDWTIAEPIVATAQATKPHHALLLDVDAGAVHLFRRGVAPRDGLRLPPAPQLPTGQELPPDLSLVATVSVATEDGVAALAALADFLPPATYKANAWESAWLDAWVDLEQRARLSSSWLAALWSPPPKAKKAKAAGPSRAVNTAPDAGAAAFVDAALTERAAWARRHPSFLVRDATPDDLRRLFELGDREVFREMAWRTMPDDIVARLATVDDDGVRESLARHTSHAPTLEAMWARGPDRVRNAIAWDNPHAPAAIFERLVANDADPQAQDFAANRTVSVEGQRLFARHPRTAVRLRVANNDAVHADALRILGDDVDDAVRAAANAHPAGPSSAYARMVALADAGKSDDVVEQIAGLDGDDLRALPLLALHGDARVRLGVACNPRCPGEVQHRLVLGKGLLGGEHKAHPTRAIVRAVAALPVDLDLAVVAAIVESGDGPAIDTLVARQDAAPPLKAWRAARSLPVDGRRVAANVEWPPFESRLAGAVWSRDDDEEVRDIAAERARFRFTPIALAD